MPRTPKDAIDDMLDQWSEERPELNTAPLGVVIRVMTLYRQFLRDATEALEEMELELFEYDALSALRRQGKPFCYKIRTRGNQPRPSTCRNWFPPPPSARP